MKILEHLKIPVQGFAPKRTAYILASINVVCAFLHFVADCDISEGIALFGLIDFLVIVFLTFVIPKTEPGRIDPLALGLLGLILHIILTH